LTATNKGAADMPSFKFLLNKFCRTVSVLDMRPDEETRKARCEKYARKNKTCGKRANFAIGEACNVVKAEFGRAVFKGYDAEGFACYSNVAL
jgi:hypothetical protein